ncbi:ABC transporter ATP-binding protein [Acidisoma silvae]|uniref:ABC transporter ATP-binding protein n=1 Tax=Acidisoma silvae TaxID=2802396 RepID=A0A964E199_9PROT|nr:ABC transporter ATP-binding protein [Acidisoma silvae]
MLSIQSIRTFYGPVQVHHDVTLEVRPRQIVSLLGGNASGKSTLMKTVLGIVKPRQGRVMFDGADITGRPTAAIIRRGIASVPESRRLFQGLTVRENLLLGAYSRQDTQAIAEDLDRILTLFPRLSQRLRQRAGVLSGGEQQMVAMGRALMSRPKLICMDEPTMGLSPLFVDQVLSLIQTINAEGVAVLMVEQNASLALRIAHHAYVLQSGRIVLQATGAAMAADPRIQDAYLGRTETAA